ncbi:restriction endonuclease subunit S [Pontibacillus halophilus]|uniref:restriction endonuclease subunit S n=1 Tax=Pontibacillus halophilus TaxID=516704 RepID=UPI0004087DB9|nr:restriction endonuclease subunit S [Pontibacillus halophilus]
MKLEDIAEIKTGLVLTRKKAEVDFKVKATYRLLTLRNIEEDGTFNDHPFDVFHSNDELSPRYFTEEGDIVMRLSDPNTAVYISKDQANLLVPSNFVLIKVKNAQVLPGYIAWYLNRDSIKRELAKSQSGTRILSTNKNVLKTISIKMLSLDNQEALIKMLSLHRKEKRLYQKLIMEKEDWFKGVSQQILQG